MTFHMAEEVGEVLSVALRAQEDTGAIDVA